MMTKNNETVEVIARRLSARDESLIKDGVAEIGRIPAGTRIESLADLNAYLYPIAVTVEFHSTFPGYIGPQKDD